jgi:predicted DNA-binding transcriptional regulator AlpA
MTARSSTKSAPMNEQEIDAQAFRNVPLLLTDAQAAALLGVSKRTFLNLRSEAWCPQPIFLGPRLLRWSVDELRAAIANMPRQTVRVQPQSLLRAKIDRLKGAA